MMQPAQTLHPFCAGAQHEMIRISQYDIRARFLNLFRIERLHRRRRADGHEGGGPDTPARGLEHTGAGGAIRGVKIEIEAGHQNLARQRE